MKRNPDERWALWRRRWAQIEERFAPPGMNLREEIGFFAVLGIAAALYHALLYGIRYFNALSDLYGWDELRGAVLLSDAHMPSYVDLLGGGDCLYGYLLAALATLALTLVHYRYFYRGGRSIYVMRRLPRWVLRRRVLVLPTMGALLHLAVAVTFLTIYYIGYLLLTPAGVGAALL